MAGDDLILFLPGESDAAIGWARASEGRIVAEGSDVSGLADNGYERIVALAPASVSGIDWIELPDLAPAQRDAAVRGLLADRVIAADTLHMTASSEADATGFRPVVWAGRDRMAGWLAALAQAGLQADAIVPALLAVEPEADGFVRAKVGSEVVVRGPRSGWADEENVTPLLAGDAEIAEMSQRAVEAGLLRLVDFPPVNLLSGPFAPGGDWAVDSRLKRWLVGLVLVVALMAMLIPLAQLWQTNRAAARLEAESSALALRSFPDAENPLAALQAEVSARRGGGAGFIATLGAVNQAVADTPNAELTGLNFTPDGILQTTVRVTNADEATRLVEKIRAQGFRVDLAAPAMNQGRLLQPITVRGE